MPSRSTETPADISADAPFSWPPLQMPSAVAENSRTHRVGGSKLQGDTKLQDDLKLLDELHQSRAVPDQAPTKPTSGSASTWTQMMDALQSEPRRAASNRQLNTRLLVGAVAALLIVAGAFVWRITAATPPAQVASQIVSPAPVAKNPVLNELVETTKALEASQQQAIDQLQVLQELVTSQQAEARKSSGQVAALNAKLEALQQSFASIPAVPAEEAAPPPRSRAKPATARSRGNAHRVASSRKTRVAAKRH